ncbi:unnamed protein product [Allacma fusca]|uniref:Uncharacterized protein n=1 Tax=Allacma fusca TaxID=39272 RepID=A0A8J2KEM2_9HEXA|nr:unnamed protein product [Allacma fusca]
MDNNRPFPYLAPALRRRRPWNLRFGYVTVRIRLNGMVHDHIIPDAISVNVRARGRACTRRFSRVDLRNMIRELFHQDLLFDFDYNPIELIIMEIHNFYFANGDRLLVIRRESRTARVRIPIAVVDDFLDTFGFIPAEFIDRVYNITVRLIYECFATQSFYVRAMAQEPIFPGLDPALAAIRPPEMRPPFRSIFLQFQRPRHAVRRRPRIVVTVAANERNIIRFLHINDFDQRLNELIFQNLTDFAHGNSAIVIEFHQHFNEEGAQLIIARRRDRTTRVYRPMAIIDEFLQLLRLNYADFA